jgi:hypothetical protein
MPLMFLNAAAFNQDLSAWNVSSVTSFNNMFTGSRLANEFASGAHHTNACLIHQAWKTNPYWDPATAFGIPGITDEACVPYLPGGALHGDPHLTFAHGGQADFRGCDGCYFNFLSTDDLSVNTRTEEAVFTLDGNEVHGSFVTEAHVLWLDRQLERWMNVSYLAKEVGDSNWGWGAVDGKCGERNLYLYPKQHRECGAARLTTTLSTLSVLLPQWEVNVTSRPVYDRISGPRHRLDLSMRPLVPERQLSVWPHGLIGQSFDGDSKPLSGRQDSYLSDTGVVRTSAMAEGAIEGSWEDYIVQDSLTVHFRYSRFGAATGTTHPRDVGSIRPWVEAWTTGAHGM